MAKNPEFIKIVASRGNLGILANEVSGAWEEATREPFSVYLACRAGLYITSTMSKYERLTEPRIFRPKLHGTYELQTLMTCHDVSGRRSDTIPPRVYGVVYEEPNLYGVLLGREAVQVLAGKVGLSLSDMYPPHTD
jgi:hypothetical protein